VGSSDPAQATNVRAWASRPISLGFRCGGATAALAATMVTLSTQRQTGVIGGALGTSSRGACSGK
jgi:hypothetical protein